MVFTHDAESALVAAVELVNTLSAPAERAMPGQLAAFYRRHGYTGRLAATGAELDRVRKLRPELRDLLLADRDTAAVLINEALARESLAVRLVRHDGQDWHVHPAAPDADFATKVWVETLFAMIEVVREDEHSRLGLCADPSCERLVLDLSRNRSRRFCSPACGNRQAVAAYRSRQRSATGGRTLHAPPSRGPGMMGGPPTPSRTPP